MWGPRGRRGHTAISMTCLTPIPSSTVGPPGASLTSGPGGPIGDLRAGTLETQGRLPLARWPRWPRRKSRHRIYRDPFAERMATNDNITRACVMGCWTMDPLEQRLFEMERRLHRRKRCGAKTRRGTPCKMRPAMRHNGRCRLHGGLSTGPRTLQGRERIAEAQGERWRRRREGQTRIDLDANT